MSEQPEALRLIQHMDKEWQEDWDGAAIRVELRRLHEECEDWKKGYALLFKENADRRRALEAAIAKATGEQA